MTLKTKGMGAIADWFKPRGMNPTGGTGGVEKRNKASKKIFKKLNKKAKGGRIK